MKYLVKTISIISIFVAGYSGIHFLSNSSALGANTDDVADLSGTKTTSHVQLAQFRFAQYSLVQMNNGANTVFSFEFSWNPEYRLTKYFGITGNFGFVPMMDQYTNSRFLNLRYGISAALYLGPVMLELGPGAERWQMNPVVNSLAVSSNLHYRFNRKLFYVLDTVFIGYTRLFQNPGAHEVRFGAQIAF